MIEINVVSDTPSYLKVSNIGDEIKDFETVLNEKYSSLGFNFGFCFRALYSMEGINSKVRFHKDENYLGMDLIMPEIEFRSYKNNIVQQRKIVGRYFFDFFKDTLIKYKYKLPTLKPVLNDLIKDMQLFLIENLWLEDEFGMLNFKVVEKVSFDKAMNIFGKADKKQIIKNTDDDEVLQDLSYMIDENTKFIVSYSLINRKWELNEYSLNGTNEFLELFLLSNKKITNEGFGDIKLQIASELTESAFSQSENIVIKSEVQALLHDLKLHQVSFDQEGIRLMFLSKKQYPDMNIYCILDKEFNVDYIMVE